MCSFIRFIYIMLNVKLLNRNIKTFQLVKQPLQYIPLMKRLNRILSNRTMSASSRSVNYQRVLKENIPSLKICSKHINSHHAYSSCFVLTHSARLKTIHSIKIWPKDRQNLNGSWDGSRGKGTNNYSLPQ